MNARAILHLDLDAFFVAVEVLRNSALAGKPLIIGGTSERGVVASCSYEARRYGVHSAMPMKMALRLCPEATVLRGDMDAYTKYSAMVTEIIEGGAPVMEKSSIDEFYVDCTGMDRYIGCWKWATELRTRIMRETGLPISTGLSVNKLVSKIGTGEAKPNGSMHVYAGTEKGFIAPLSTAKIPGIGRETYKKLSFMGVRTIEVLSGIPRPLLEREFGKVGGQLWQKANAQDDSPVEPYHERKSIGSERTLTQDTLDIGRIRDMLIHMTEQLSFELRTTGKLASCITVKIRYADFNTYTRQLRIPYTSHDGSLIRYACELFDKLYERRQMIRLIGVRLSALVQGCYQVRLFEDTEKEIQLMIQMDRIRRRFGPDAVMRACGMTRGG